MKSIQLLVFSLALLAFSSCGEEKTNQGTKQATITIGFGLQDFLKSYLLSTGSTKYLETMKRYNGATQSSNTFSIHQFVVAFEKLYPSESIVRLFDLTKSKGLSMRFTNKQVEEYLNEEYILAVQLLEAQLQKRISLMTSEIPQFTSNLKKGKITIKLTGIKDVEKALYAIQSNAHLEFFQVYANNEIAPISSEIFDKCDELLLSGLDSTSKISNIQTIRSFILTNEYNFGSVLPEHQSTVNALLNHPEVLALYSNDFKIMWSANLSESAGRKKVYELYAVKTSNKNNVNSTDIERATPGMNDYGKMTVNVTMTQEGTERWRIMTAENVGRTIAITLDEKVYSAPIVNGEISGGSTEISGNFSEQEAKDLASLINAGSYKIPFAVLSVK